MKKKLDEIGIQHTYSALPDADLDLLVRDYRTKKPETGFRYLRGHLRSLGLNIQKRRVLGSLGRVDRLGRVLRRRVAIRRRKYFSSRPNAMWHCDGHHKLIKYGFVIHGFIDGNCRTVCYFAVSSFAFCTQHSALGHRPSCQHQQPCTDSPRTLPIGHS